MLGANLEALLLTGTAHAGTGNELEIFLAAGSGGGTLMDLAGDDDGDRACLGRRWQ